MNEEIDKLWSYNLDTQDTVIKQLLKDIELLRADIAKLKEENKAALQLAKDNTHNIIQNSKAIRYNQIEIDNLRNG